MERLCFVMELNPGQEEKYDRVHQEMFPEMHDALVEAGDQNYTITDSALDKLKDTTVTIDSDGDVSTK